MKIRRFMVFAGAVYYASGGASDYIGSFDTLDEAKAARDDWMKEKVLVWSQILDLEEGTWTGDDGGYAGFWVGEPILSKVKGGST